MSSPVNPSSTQTSTVLESLTHPPFNALPIIVVGDLILDEYLIG